MSHMTDSAPWLKRYVQNALSTSPRPQTLHGSYLQVISSVSARRHLRVYDGRHTAEAVLSPAAASHLDADPDDLGVTTLNLTGHLIAPVSAVVVPDASTTPPTATLVLSDLRVFSDQCAQRPLGSLPAVDRDPQVLNCLRANVGRKLATFATQSTFVRHAAASDRTVADIQDLTQVFDDIVDNPALPPPDLLNDIGEFRTNSDMDLQRADDVQGEPAVDQLPAIAERSEKPVVVVDLSQSPGRTPPRQAKDGAMSDENDSDEEMPELQILSVPGIGDGDEEDQEDEYPVGRTQQTDDADDDGQEGDGNGKGLDEGEERTGDGKDVDVDTGDANDEHTGAEDDRDWEISFGSQNQTPDGTGDDDVVAGDALPQTQHFTCEDDDDEDEDEEDGDETANRAAKEKPASRGVNDEKDASNDVADGVDEDGPEILGDDHRDNAGGRFRAAATVHGPKRKSASKGHGGREKGPKDTLGHQEPGAMREVRNNNGEITFGRKGVPLTDLDPEVEPAPGNLSVTAGDTVVDTRAKRALHLPVEGMDTQADPSVGMGAVVAKADADFKEATTDADAPASRVADVENGRQPELEEDDTMDRDDAADTIQAADKGDAVKPSSQAKPSGARDGTSAGDAVVKDKNGQKTVDTDVVTEETTHPADSEKPTESEKNAEIGKAAKDNEPAGNEAKADDSGTADKPTGKDLVADTEAKHTDADKTEEAADVRPAEPLDSSAAATNDAMDVELPTSTVEVKESTTTVEVAEVEGTEATQPPATEEEKATQPPETAEDVDVIEPETQPPETDKDGDEIKPETKEPTPAEAAEAEDEIEPVEKKGSKRKAADFLRNDENQRKQQRSNSVAEITKEAALKKLHDELELLRNFRRKVDKNPTGFILNPDAFLPPLPGSATAKKKANTPVKESFPPPDLSNYKKKKDPESEELPQVPDSAPI